MITMYLACYSVNSCVCIYIYSCIIDEDHSIFSSQSSALILSGELEPALEALDGVQC